MPPRQPLPAPPEPPPLDSLPPEVLTRVVERLVDFDRDLSKDSYSRLAASRFSELNRACRQVANEFLNQEPATCYATSAARLKHAANQPDSSYMSMAAAIHDLAYVYLDFEDIPAERLDDATRMLQAQVHPHLRGLTIMDDWTSIKLDSGKLADMLRHRSTLKELTLYVKELRFPQSLTEAIASLSGLESLCLMDHKHLDDTSAGRLADALGSLPKLRSIDVSDIDSAPALMRCLPRLLRLQSLKTSCCRASSKDWRAVAENLQRLHAGQCASPAGTATALRSLELSYAGFGDEGVAQLAPALSTLRGLHKLSLSGNDIGPAGMALLAASLRGMGDLQVLALGGGNRLHGEGMKHLAGALEKLPHLQDLSLLTTGLDAVDMRRLGAALRSSQRLQRLQLSGNSLNGCSGADWAALLGSPRLEVLDLTSCSLGPQDMAPLAAGLKMCPSLKRLDLRSNAAGTIEGAAKALADGLERLPQLEMCHLPNLSEADLEVLLPTLRQLQGSCLREVLLSDETLVAKLRPMLPGVKVW